MNSRLLVAALAVGLALAACGSDATATTTTTAVIVTTTVATATTSTSVSTTTTTTIPAPTTTAPVAHIEIPQGTGVLTVIPDLPAGTGGVAIDPNNGTVYIADMGAGRTGTRVWKLTAEGGLSLFVNEPTLITGAAGNAVDADGNLYQASYNTGSILKVTPSGEVSVFVDQGISGPIGVVANPAGGIYVADCNRDAVTVVSADGEAELLARDDLLSCPNGITLDEQGNIYVANFGDGKVLKVTPDGAVSLLVELPGENNGHLAYHDGLLYVAARGANQIYTVTLEGEATLFAGSGEQGLEDGPLLEATLIFPNGVAIAPDGSVWINQPIVTNGNNRPVAVRKLVP